VTGVDRRTVVVIVLVEDGLGVVVMGLLVGGLRLVGLFVLIDLTVTVETFMSINVCVTVDKTVVRVGRTVDTIVLVDFPVLIVDVIVVFLGTFFGNVDEVRVLIVITVDFRLLIVVVIVVRVGLVDVRLRVDVRVTITWEGG